MNAKLLFYTCANKTYEDFVPLYAYSVLNSVENAIVEIGVENINSISSNNRAAINLITQYFGHARIHIHDVPWTGPHGNKILPNSVRFITVPERVSDHVYIGDIDIIFLEKNISNIHIDHMKQTGLPYSNSIRENTTRMSGLHYTRYSAHYPLPDITDIDLENKNDEELLYEIVRRNGHPVPNGSWFRPIHGIHASPNRLPFDTVSKDGRPIPGWNVKEYSSQYLSMIKTDRFKSFRENLSPSVNSILDICADVASGKPPSSYKNSAYYEIPPPRNQPIALRSQSDNASTVLLSEGNWHGQTFELPEISRDSMFRFSVSAQPDNGNLDMHVMLRARGENSRYRWLLIHRGLLLEDRTFAFEARWLTNVGEISLQECNELLIRIRATENKMARVGVANVTLATFPDTTKHAPVPVGGKKQNLSMIIEKERIQRIIQRYKDVNSDPSHGILNITPRFGLTNGGDIISIFINSSVIDFNLSSSNIKVRFDGWSSFAYSDEILSVAQIGRVYKICCVTPKFEAGPPLHAMATEHSGPSQCVEVAIETPDGEIGGAGFVFLNRARSRAEILLNIGAGKDLISDWINLDRHYFRVHDQESVLWDFSRGLRMFERDSVDAITVSHALMYIPLSSHSDFFNECFRVLKRGGVLRISEDDAKVRRANDCHYYVGPTSPIMIRQALSCSGFEVFDHYPSTTKSRYASIMRVNHMEYWDHVKFQKNFQTGVYFIEGVKRALPYQIGSLFINSPISSDVQDLLDQEWLLPDKNPVITVADLGEKDSHFVADPFMIEVNGKVFVFYESRANPHAHISVSTSTDGVHWQYVGIALKENFHLSFPHVFSYLDDIYMIPESSSVNQVRLYKATNFPLEWKLEKILLSGDAFADSNIIFENNLWWMFSYVKGELNLFYSKSMLGPYTPHPSNPICTDRRFSRPGGKVLKVEEKLYRFSQDCSRVYGERISLHTILRLNPDEYVERIENDNFVHGPDLLCYVAWNSKIHHIDFLQRTDKKWLVVFDGTAVDLPRRAVLI